MSCRGRATDGTLIAFACVVSHRVGLFCRVQRAAPRTKPSTRCCAAACARLRPPADPAAVTVTTTLVRISGITGTIRYWESPDSAGILATRGTGLARSPNQLMLKTKRSAKPSSKKNLRMSHPETSALWSSSESLLECATDKHEFRPKPGMERILTLSPRPPGRQRPRCPPRPFAKATRTLPPRSTWGGVGMRPECMSDPTSAGDPALRALH